MRAVSAPSIREWQCAFLSLLAPCLMLAGVSFLSHGIISESREWLVHLRFASLTTIIQCGETQWLDWIR